MKPISPKSALKKAHSIQVKANKLGLKQPVIADVAEVDHTHLYDILVTDGELRDITRELFMGKHYAQAVKDGFQFICDVARSKSGSDQDGTKLFDSILGGENTKIELKTKFRRNDSKNNLRIGYMNMCKGCYMGIRNPRMHEPTIKDDPMVAVELLCLANHLIIMFRNSKRIRGSKKKKGITK